MDKRIIGLDPVFRSCVKMKVKDMYQLQLVNLPDTSKHDEKIELYTFRGHVVNKVEIMGLVVMSDKKDRLHSFAVDDATGVILCVQWKPRNPGTQLEHHHLPASLQAKLAEVETCRAAAQEGELCLGDLVQVRGWVSTFRDQLQITVLDMRKFDNPCVEIEAVLQYPSVYQVYKTPFIPPAAARNLLAGPSIGAFNELAVQEAVSRHIQGSGCSQVTVTPSDIIVWPSVAALLPASEEDTATRDITLGVISSALQSLESGRGNVYRLAGPTDTYEMIRADCPMAAQLLSLLKIACQNGKNAEMGCHVQHLITSLARVPRYSRVDSRVVSYLLSCLETSSDIICISAQRYAPVS
ncbi:unnamed protein product [Candidula unifasciata]|uniref:CST complex subunit STN1 n=1 Tax=Candidula unifasciata TaxID=100452 RepID=A0A8S3Z3L5_9EUPU|nr:unnamed protein product [Candidula unifasciata]